jgi:molecular chaperone GrpE
VARELLGVLDNLHLAVKNIPETTDKNLRTGIEMVLKQFQTTLEKQGVAPISTIGQNFNPELHEAMGQEPSEQAIGTVTQELVQGYTLHGRLLRPTKVIVSMGKPAN